MDLKLLKDLVNVAVIDRFDHRNLNLDIPEFKELNPTAENISYVIYELLRPLIDRDKKLVIVLYETERNSVEYDGE